MSTNFPCRQAGCGALTKRADKGYCEAHKEKRSRWSTVSKEYSAAHYGTAWRKLRKQVILRDMGICQECLRHNRYEPGTQVDHILDKADGGTDDMDNLQLLCRSCHNTKTAKAGVRHKLGRRKG